MNVQTEIENVVLIEKGAIIRAASISCPLVSDPDYSFLTGMQAVASNSLTTYSSLCASACQRRPKRPLRAVQAHLSGGHAVNMPLVLAHEKRFCQRAISTAALRPLTYFQLPLHLYILFKVKYTILT